MHRRTVIAFVMALVLSASALPVSGSVGSTSPLLPQLVANQQPSWQWGEMAFGVTPDGQLDRSSAYVSVTDTNNCKTVEVPLGTSYVARQTELIDTQSSVYQVQILRGLTETIQSLEVCDGQFTLGEMQVAYTPLSPRQVSEYCVDNCDDVLIRQVAPGVIRTFTPDTTSTCATWDLPEEITYEYALGGATVKVGQTDGLFTPQTYQGECPSVWFFGTHS